MNFSLYTNSFEDNGTNLISIFSTQAPQRDSSQEVDESFNVEKQQMLTFKGLKGLKGLYTNLDRRVTLYSATTKIKLKFYYSNNVIETIKSKVCFFSKRKGEVIS